MYNYTLWLVHAIFTHCACAACKILLLYINLMCYALWLMCYIQKNCTKIGDFNLDFNLRVKILHTSYIEKNTSAKTFSRKEQSFCHFEIDLHSVSCICAHLFIVYVYSILYISISILYITYSTCSRLKHNWLIVNCAQLIFNRLSTDDCYKFQKLNLFHVQKTCVFLNDWFTTFLLKITIAIDILCDFSYFYKLIISINYK